MKDIITLPVFNEEIAAKEGRLLLFYSGWCPFCTSFLPEFEKCAAMTPGSLARVSTDKLPELEDKFSIEVVPTVLYFRDGKLVKRLDGLLGRGLNGENLRAFIKECGIGGKDEKR
jgi:thioredoxin 1